MIKATHRLGIVHEYREHPGAHDWDYWDRRVPDALAFHAKVLRLETVAAPTPGPGKEVLVQVRAASLNAADLYLLKGEPALLRGQQPRR